MFVKKEELLLASVKQYKVNCPNEHKAVVVRNKILEFGDAVRQTIIFVRTQESASMLHNSLVDFHYQVATTQGALNQEDRDKIIKGFAGGLTSVLISTDALAEGFDQAQVLIILFVLLFVVEISCSHVCLFVWFFIELISIPWYFS